MLTNRSLFIYMAICVIMLSACTVRHQYVPELHPLDPARFAPLDSIEISKQVSVINAQDSKDEFLIGEISVHDYYGSLHDITESAVKNANQELAKRLIDVDTDDSSEKSLNLKVTSARMVRGMWVLRAIIDMSVETGSGLRKEYHVENVSPMTVPRAFNGAAAVAVINMFSDPDILDYLSQEQ